MTGRGLVFALTTLAGVMAMTAARAQELNAWDQRGAAPLPAHAEPKTRAEVRAELPDAREAGWQTNSGKLSWFPEPALIIRLAQRAEERVARRVQAERLAAAHKRQVERVPPVALRQLRPALTLPAAHAPALDAVAALPTSARPTTATAIRSDAAPMAVRRSCSYRFDIRPNCAVDVARGSARLSRGRHFEAGAVQRAQLPVIEPPEAPASAAESRLLFAEG